MHDLCHLCGSDPLNHPHLGSSSTQAVAVKTATPMGPSLPGVSLALWTPNPQTCRVQLIDLAHCQFYVLPFRGAVNT